MPVVLSRLRHVLHLVKMLEDLDLSRFEELPEALYRLREAETLRERTLAAVALARLIVEMTPTAVDDDVVRTLDELLQRSVLDALVRLVAYLDSRRRAADMLDVDVSIMLAEDLNALGYDRSAVEALGVSWSMLIEIARLVIELSRMLRRD